MTEYTTLRNIDLQRLLADRNLSITGSKVTMIERLQDGDAAKQRSLPLRNPDGAAMDLRRTVHQENIRKHMRQPQMERPSMSRLMAVQRRLNNGKYTAEWNAIKQKLLDGKCLGLVCCLCGTATLAESMQILSDGPNIDCGGRLPASCKDQDQCSSCRQIMQEVADDITREEPNYFTRRDQMQRLASIKRAAKNSTPDEVVDVERHCLDEDCGGIETCGACKWVKYEQKMKRAETGAWRANRGPRRPKQRGLPYWPPLPSSSDRSHDSIDRPRRGMIDAIMGPQMRNEDLRRRRASKILTGYPESYEGPASGVARKRRFSNLGLEYPLPSRHPLAQCIRDEEKREELERTRAQTHHERPSWFGSEKDPLPDFWMGRPTLSEREISILKCLPSIPKYYLSESEDNDILLPEGAKEKRLCTVIRRLEAELMSRDFWMQSLGYNAADAFGKFPSGHYVVAGTDSLS
ncbi:hypothetical protein D6D17_00680 [Aureobasidium pullulans]|nr:hypothetical protein D6D17_00680 [Aureobasidium pullulans]TIA54623.1 hypothetical protein D6C79_00884 [Aureobasidium pullulans]TIA81441.1 hypothetical protein D6C76_02815 [Aureobasidium pullulans]